jgi:hypothetical protein
VSSTNLLSSARELISSLTNALCRWAFTVVRRTRLRHNSVGQGQRRARPPLSHTSTNRISRPSGTIRAKLHFGAAAA